jgi:hypothetical protein
LTMFVEMATRASARGWPLSLREEPMSSLGIVAGDADSLR